MSASKVFRVIRTELWNNDPHCHWCGVLTNIDYDGKNGALNNDDATLDHIYHRGDSQRKVNLPKQKEDVVLACWHCNNRRGTAWNHNRRFDPLFLPGKIDWDRPWEE